jgi:hypothetical protein
MTTAAGATGAAASGRTRRLPIRTTIPAAVVVTIARPLAWLLGLTGFLAGGGLVLLTAPIVVLPTPTGIQNALGAPISTLVVGTPSPAMVLLIGGGTIAGLGLVIGGLVVGAWAERNLIGLQLDAAGDEGLLVPPDLDGAPGALRVAVVRAFALLPVVAVFIMAWQPLYDAAYHELVLPDELATPLGLRVLRDVPWVVAAVVVAWALGDAAAALGVRRLVVGRRPILVAWLLGWVDIVRRPVRVTATAAFGIAVLALLTVPSMAAAAAGWARVRDVMARPDDAVGELSTVALWVAVWLGGLVLAGVGAAVRAAAWTLESTPVPSAGDPGGAEAAARA